MNAPRSTAHLPVLLKHLRVGKGLSVKRVADVLDVHWRAVYRYEAGQAVPDAEALEALALLYDVDSDVLHFAAARMPQKRRSAPKT